MRACIEKSIMIPHPARSTVQMSTQLSYCKYLDSSKLLFYTHPVFGSTLDEKRDTNVNSELINFAGKGVIPLLNTRYSRKYTKWGCEVNSRACHL